MRDSLLAVSGEPPRDSGGPALVIENPENTGSLSLKGRQSAELQPPQAASLAGV